MTPAAHLSAAIEVLDRILAGGPVEQSLTNWGRANRFAGSGDRRAIRDLVFDALRCRRSFAALGGSESGRGLILGGVRAAGLDPALLFTGQGHAPPPISDAEKGRAPEGNAALDVPDWLAPRLQVSLGEDFAGVMAALRHRAPVFLRVNLARGTLPEAADALAAEGIQTRAVPFVNTALEVTGNERKIQRAAAYLSGLVELQDASSQAVIAALSVRAGMRVLDYCAGGGGKTLALAARGVEPDAHDLNPHRLVDLPTRATRAGARVRIVQSFAKSDIYDLILADVPCSGSGSWRRDPQGKWALTEARLAELLPVQAAILNECAGLTGPAGCLAYATCSLLADENEAQVAAFLDRHPDWRQESAQRFSPLLGGDGFFVAQLTRQGSMPTQP